MSPGALTNLHTGPVLEEMTIVANIERVFNSRRYNECSKDLSPYLADARLAIYTSAACSMEVFVSLWRFRAEITSY